jgi:hypothetical protein
MGKKDSGTGLFWIILAILGFKWLTSRTASGDNGGNGGGTVTPKKEVEISAAFGWNASLTIEIKNNSWDINKRGNANCALITVNANYGTIYAYEFLMLPPIGSTARFVGESDSSWADISVQFAYWNGKAPVSALSPTSNTPLSITK